MIPRSALFLTPKSSLFWLLVVSLVTEYYLMHQVGEVLYFLAKKASIVVEALIRANCTGWNYFWRNIVHGIVCLWFFGQLFDYFLGLLHKESHSFVNCNETLFYELIQKNSHAFDIVFVTSVGPLANIYSILQIYHAKTFRMRYTRCLYNNPIQKYS